MKIDRISTLLLLVMLLVSNGSVAGDPLRVVVTIKPIHSLVAGLMEGIEQPELLIKGKQTPYGFQPSDEQKKSLEQADLIIWVGPELEASLQQPLASLGSHTRVLELLSSSELKILPTRESDDRRDPFFWLDSRNAIILLDELARTLIEIDPARSHVYTRNRSKMLGELIRVDREFEYGYRGLKGGVAFLYYDTLHYFEQAYAMKIHGVLLESPNQKPDTARLLKARAQIRDGEFACLLTESALPSDQLSMLTSGASISVGELDSFGTRFEAGPGLYTEVMRYNTKVIRQCLQVGAETIEQAAGDEESITVGGRFILINQYGEEVRSEDMLGKYQLIYFGYTSCPDICPLSLTTMNLALKKLGDKADLLQPYFISVDPERDTVDQVRQYVEFFHPRLIGLTGSKAMIDKVVKQYHVQYEKVIDDPSKPDEYQMDHTASVFMIAPDGRFLAKFAHGIMPGQLAKKIEEFLP